MFGNKPKTLDGILSSFTKTIEELKLLQEANKEQAEAKADLAVTLLVQSAELREEADRAAKIEENINSLLA